MLKKFLLNTLSSFVGAWLAIGLGIVAVVLICIAVVAGMAKDSVQSEQLSKKSVLRIDLSGEIVETESPEDIDITKVLRGDIEKPLTLDMLTKAVQEASSNKNIAALYLNCEGAQAAPATIHALRNALLNFKLSGKKIYAYADSFSQADYYLATTADSIFLNPQGMLDLHGVSGTTIYMKDLFDKLGISFQVLKVGTFKSAVEPYILNEMSEPARAQLDTLYRSIWNVMKEDMAAARGIKASSVDSLINSDYIYFRKALFAKGKKLVDGLAFRREMDQKFADLTGKDADEINYVSPEFLASQTDWARFRDSKKQVALLYATGEIAESDQAGIYCEKLVPQIIELADDDNVKAMVLRVNSPGGSVFGTVQIAEALQYFKDKKKPLIISMGDYAASGGYWLSAGGDRIFADSLTITGSIGIFGLVPQMEGLAGKIGVHPQTVSTNPGAIFSDLFRPMGEGQHAAAQRWIEEGYDAFIERVATGRKLKPSYVRTIAEGRVYDAMQAKRLGLVDELGSLQKALDYASKKAGLGEDYDVGVYPEIEPSIWSFVPSGRMAEIIRSLHSDYPDIDFATIFKVAALLDRNPCQVRMPEFRIVI